MKKLIVFLLTIILLLPQPINPSGLLGNGDSEFTDDILKITPSVEVIAAPAPDIAQSYDNIPVLMYHVLEDYSGTYEQLYVSPQVFRQHLTYLKDQGYQTVTLQEVLEHWSQAKPLPDKPIVLSFDDGYLSMYTQAFPLLAEFGYRGTFYLHTSKINTAGGLTSTMIKEMVAGGMEIGSHTLAHPDLTKIGPSRLKRELSASKQILEELSGSPVLTLAYPAGRYNQEVQNAVQKAGYLGAVTTQYGATSRAQNPFTLKRVRINKSDGVDGFITKIRATTSP